MLFFFVFSLFWLAAATAAVTAIVPRTFGSANLSYKPLQARIAETIYGNEQYYIKLFTLKLYTTSELTSFAVS